MGKQDWNRASKVILETDIYYLTSRSPISRKDRLKNTKRVLLAGWGPEVGGTQSKEEILDFFEEVGYSRPDATKCFSSLERDGYIKKVS